MPRSDSIEKVHTTRQSVARVFSQKWEQMKENSRFMRLEQYSESQLAKFSQENRVPYVFDYITSGVNTYLGIQRDRRTEIFYYPVEKGDEVRCEVLNAVKDHALSANNFIYVESDVFQDGLIEKIGCVAFEWSIEKNPLGMVKMSRVPPRHVVWDLNSREYDHSDATWMSRHRMYGKRELKNRRPEFAKQIDKMSLDLDDLEDLGLTDDYLDQILDSDLGTVALIEFWEKKYDNRYFIRSGRNVDGAYYESQKSAEKEILQRLEIFRAQASQASLVGQNAPPEPDFSVIRHRVPVFHYTEVAHDMVFEEKDLDEPFYPLSVYHPFFHDGDWWGVVDTMKDPQRYYNKMMAMSDHWIGTMSKGLLLIDGNAPEQEAKEVEAKFSKTGGVVKVQDVENYKLFESKGPAPQLFSMADLARMNLEEHAGGRNFQGKKETASESGVAVRTRIEQGAVSGFVIYDNLRRWKLSVGEKLAWYLTNYMTAAQVVRIEGENLVQETMQMLSENEGRKWFTRNPLRPGVGFVEVNTEVNNSLEDLRVDVNVDEARWSITKNQEILQEVNMSLQSNPLFAKTFPPEAMLEFLNLPFSVKEQARQRMQILEQQQMQLEAAKAIKPPSVSLDLGDVQELPPDGQVQVLAKYFGIQIDPRGLTDKTQEELRLKVLGEIQKLMLANEKHSQDLRSMQEKHDQALQMNAEKHGQQLEIAAINSALTNIKSMMERKPGDVNVNSSPIALDLTLKTPEKKKKKRITLQRDKSGKLSGAEVDEE